MCCFLGCSLPSFFARIYFWIFFFQAEISPGKKKFINSCFKIFILIPPRWKNGTKTGPVPSNNTGLTRTRTQTQTHTHTQSHNFLSVPHTHTHTHTHTHNHKVPPNFRIPEFHLFGLQVLRFRYRFLGIREFAVAAIGWPHSTSLRDVRCLRSAGDEKTYNSGVVFMIISLATHQRSTNNTSRQATPLPMTE
jgi:hypothetical protein